jgi:hypothetical protein
MQIRYNYVIDIEQLAQENRLEEAQSKLAAIQSVYQIREGGHKRHT